MLIPAPLFGLNSRAPSCCCSETGSAVITGSRNASANPNPPIDSPIVLDCLDIDPP
jgi:hypothetical protein